MEAKSITGKSDMMILNAVEKLSKIGGFQTMKSLLIKQDSDGRTPLHLAYQSANIELALATVGLCK